MAPPGVGKTETIRRVDELWRATENLHVAPDSVTRASLLDVLARSSVKSNFIDVKTGEQSFQLFHGLNIAADEFAVLCPAHDIEFLGSISKLFDNREQFQEERRSRQEKLLDIKFPILNLLAGAQPGFLSELLPEIAWTQGFTSRLLMIYSGIGQKVTLRLGAQSRNPEYTRIQDLLKHDLTTITQLYGAVDFTPEAEKALIAWYESGLQPIPVHSRLQHYNTRRLLTTFKLCIISSVSRSNTLTVELDDLTRAQDWLLEVEEKMPDIFRDMSGKSDKQIIDDLYDFMWRLFARDQKSIHEHHILTFLQSKCPADKIVRIMELCERMHLMERDRSTHLPMWKPCIKDNLPGVE